MLQVKSMRRRGSVIGCVDTGASIYHRYSARWIAENCILFKSSDIGYRAIVVKEKCLMYFANVDAKDGVLHVALFDEQWDPVGIEFCCDIEKDNNKR